MEFSDLNNSTSVPRTSAITATGSSSYATSPQTARTPIYPINTSRKSGQTTENSSRLFSPYTAPSAINVENKSLAQGSGGPIYQHNIAITKYHHISATPKPRTNQSMNILA